MADTTKLVSEATEHPLITKLKSLEAKQKADEARPATDFSNGVEDGEGRKTESLNRTKNFIKQVKADPAFPKSEKK